MKAKDIKPGHWYETKMGVGECIHAVPSVSLGVKVAAFNIVAPIPRGRCFVVVRDVVTETAKPQ